MRLRGSRVQIVRGLAAVAAELAVLTATAASAQGYGSGASSWMAYAGGQPCMKGSWSELSSNGVPMSFSVEYCAGANISSPPGPWQAPWQGQGPYAAGGMPYGYPGMGFPGAAPFFPGPAAPRPWPSYPGAYPPGFGSFGPGPNW